MISNFPSKLEIFTKWIKKSCIGIGVFVYEKKEKYPIYVSKKKKKKIKKNVKRHYVLIKDLNTFIFDHTLHHGKKYFCRYCVQAFITAGMLKNHARDCFKINGKQIIKMPKKVNMLN